MALAALGLVALCSAAGVLSVVMGDLAISKPVFLAVLPLMVVIGFTLLISPKALLLAIIVLRGGANELFDRAQLGPLGGLGGLVNLAVIVLAAALLLREPGRVPRAAWWAWLPFLGMQFVGLVYSPDQFAQLRLALAQVSTFAMFLVAFHLVDGTRSLLGLFRLIVVSSLPVVMLTLVAIATGTTAASGLGAESVSGRYSGPFPHPNVLAFYLVLMIGIVLYLLKRNAARLSPWLRAGGVLYLLLLLGLLFATKTRSAWIAAALLFFLYGAFFERRYLMYLLAAPALGLLIPEFRDRIVDLGQGNEVVQYARLNSFAWRQLIWTEGLRWMDASRYLLGYGAGGFFYNSVVFFSMAGGRNWGAHSVLVQLFFDLGIVGVASYLWMFWSCWRLMRSGYQADPQLGVIFTATLGTYLVISLSDNMLGYLVYNWYFWLVIGAVCAWSVRPHAATADTPAASGTSHTNGPPR